MKFQFKIQGYQTEAVEDTANLPKVRFSPRRKKQAIVMQMLSLTRSGFSTISAIFRF